MPFYPLRHHQTFFDDAHRLGGKYLTSWVVWTNHSQPFVTALVGKRVLKLATDRNKLKRQLRHIAQNFFRQHSIQHTGLVISLRWPATRLSYAQLKQEVFKHLDRHVL